MLKIYLTQLRGVFQKIIDDNEDSFEDAARLLAQAAISDGTIYVFGFDEMKSVEIEALESANKIVGAKRLPIEKLNVEAIDRVLLFAPQDSHTEAAALAREISELGAMTVGLSTSLKDGDHAFSEAVDVHINIHGERALIPMDNGDRIGVPTALAGLFSYHGLYFTLAEILEDQQ